MSSPAIEMRSRKVGFCVASTEALEGWGVGIFGSRRLAIRWSGLAVVGHFPLFGDAVHRVLRMPSGIERLSRVTNSAGPPTVRSRPPGGHRFFHAAVRGNDSMTVGVARRKRAPRVGRSRPIRGRWAGQCCWSALFLFPLRCGGGYSCLGFSRAYRPRVPKFVILDNDLGSFLTIRTHTARVFESAGESLLGTKVVGDKAMAATSDAAMKTDPVTGWNDNDRHCREGDDRCNNDDCSDGGADHDNGPPHWLL